MRRPLAMLLVTASAAASAADYSLRDGEAVVGAMLTVTASADETLLDVGRRFDLGYHDMARANADIDIWLPPPGTALRLPLQFVLPAAPPRGIVLNLPEYRLYFFGADEPASVATYPMSIGRMDWETPLGLTRITAKAANPAWYPPQSVRDEHAADGDPLPRVVPPGPANPLGTRALRLGLPGYLIHGTNRPAGVGMRVTHGCLRLFPEDIERLFDLVPVGTPVRIVNQPAKAGWSGGRLWLEVHPQLEAVADGDAREAADDDAAAPDADSGVPAAVEPAEADLHPSLATQATRALVAATAERPAVIDWASVERAVLHADGLPVVVGREARHDASAGGSAPTP